ncbi:HACD1 dehydratase, partial [Polypterus senegalus]
MASGEDDGSVEEKDNHKKRTISPFALAWLTFYNIAMTAGWMVLAVAMIRFYFEKGTHKGLYKSISKTLKFFQTFAVLEVRIVRTSVIVTGVQVSSRIFMVWFVTNSIKQLNVKLFGLRMMSGLLVPRDLGYEVTIVYNLFIILYPVGVAGELMTIYAALPIVQKSGMFSVRLPNKYNVSFDYYYFLIIVMISYIPRKSNGASEAEALHTGKLRKAQSL